MDDPATNANSLATKKPLASTSRITDDMFNIDQPAVGHSTVAVESARKTRKDKLAGSSINKPT